MAKQRQIVKGTKTQKTPKELKAWEKEKKLIPVMIRKYCHGKHGTKGEELCEECRALTDYALFRLEKCPFKVNKKFCSFCKVHCYKPDMRERIKDVMKWAGPRMMYAPRVRHEARLSDDKLQTEIKKRGKGESECLIKNF